MSKSKQIKREASRGKEINIIAEINEKENNKTIENTSGTKSWFF